MMELVPKEKTREVALFLSVMWGHSKEDIPQVQRGIHQIRYTPNLQHFNFGFLRFQICEK